MIGRGEAAGRAGPVDAVGRLALADGEIHAWIVSLALDPPAVAALRRALCSDELRRAEQFHFEADRRRFIAARGMLRTLLGAYLGAAPESLLFDYNPFGKPSLCMRPGRDRLDFNLSHSRDVAVIGITRDRAIGADVERMREDLPYGDIARRCFSSSERAAFEALPRWARREAFFRCWTRKEAYVKARGGGLTIPFETFDVSLAAGPRTGLLGSRDCAGGGTAWTFWEVMSGPEYLAAVAVEGDGLRLSRRWHPTLRST
jgi:4'-phosphopantetheinyl transferase